MKVVILCGGTGIRLQDSLDFVPKAMVKIGNKPILWHVMKSFAQFGFTEFVLALGKNSSVIRDYFLHYDQNVNDLTFTLGQPLPEFKTQHLEENWKITFAETGEESGTGARLFRCQKYLENENFFVSYADCLADIDIKKLLAFHESSGKTATVSGVMPPFRYGEFFLEDGVPVEYKETSRLKSPNGWVNGGFMVFQPTVFQRLTPFNECVLEKEVFKGLVENKQLAIFQHEGFWQCLDNDREYKYLNGLCEKNSEYWLKSANLHD